MIRHELPPLPYARNALAPFLSEETLGLHYDKHHRGYVDKLNQLLPGTDFEDAALDEIVERATGPIFNNGAQAWNHAFYWSCLSPEPVGIPPELARELERHFGSVDDFRRRFAEAATNQFGSGWAWLAKDERGRLLVESTANAGNPLREGRLPLLTCDVWEHAYYLDYRNRRGEYVEAFWARVNWSFVMRNFLAGGASELLPNVA